MYIFSNIVVKHWHVVFLANLGSILLIWIGCKMNDKSLKWSLQISFMNGHNRCCLDKCVLFITPSRVPGRLYRKTKGKSPEGVLNIHKYIKAAHQNVYTGQVKQSLGSVSVSPVLPCERRQSLHHNICKLAAAVHRWAFVGNKHEFDISQTGLRWGLYRK